MIRAWTILEPKAKNPIVQTVEELPQYPVFLNQKDARIYKKLWLVGRFRIVRCQIRIEGTK